MYRNCYWNNFYALVFINNKKNKKMKTLALNNRNGSPVFFNDLLEGFSPIFNRIFDEDVKAIKAVSKPAVNVKETEQSFVLEVAAPGLQKTDFQIKIEKDVLSISTEVKNESETNADNYKRKEFNYQAFKRSFTLPENINADKITAEYKDGILHVTIAKAEKEKEQLKVIAVN
jgi:HSP20 family protein